MKGFSTFPKAQGFEPHHQIVLCHIQDTCCGWVLPLSRDAIGAYYSPRRLRWEGVKKIVVERMCSKLD